MRIDAILHVAEQKLAAKFGTHIETGGGTMVQADWAQNDETAADYVKNRPGGYYGELVTVDEAIYSGEIEQAQSEMLVNWLLVAGQTYKVTIGEVTKTYTAFADSFSGFPGVTIGDGTIEDAAKSGEMFALFSVEYNGDKEALLACPVEDVGKTIRITTEAQKRKVHKIPTELLDLGGVDESINQTNAALDALYGDISSINKTLTEGPITFKRGNKTLELGKYDANNGLILRWDNVNGGYTMLSQSGLVAKYSDREFFMTVFNVSLIEKTHGSGIHFKLEKSDINGGTRFILDNVAGDKTTFYASGKIINSNKLLQLSAKDTITEDKATTLRGVKTPEQEYDAANKKYVDQRLPSPATAQVGQIVMVKAVDESGHITETEAVDMAGGELTWHEVIDHETTEVINDLRISTDKSGRIISGYHAIGMILCINVPADSTQQSTNGAFWVYPISADFLSSGLRYIQTVPGWKTTPRYYNYFYAGNNRAMYLSNAQAAKAIECPDTVLDGIRVYVHSKDDHIPVGTKVRCLVLSKGWEA